MPTEPQAEGGDFRTMVRFLLRRGVKNERDMPHDRRHVRRERLPVDPEYRDMRDLGLAVFDRLHADVLLPFITDGEVVGGLAIGPRVSGDVYESFEIEAIQSLTDQAAAALPRKLAASA